MFDPTRHPSQAGALLVTGCAALVTTTVWLLPGTNADRLAACTVAAVMMLLAMAFRAVVRSDSDPHLLVGYPLIVFGGLAVLGHVATAVSPTYTGMFTLAFIYVGLCTPRGTTAVLIPPAIGAWLLSNGVLDQAALRATEVRLPVAICIWACAGGLLSQHAQSTMRAAESLWREARRDAMTGLHNRRALDDMLAIAHAGDVVVLLDLDHFKAINDKYGHDIGDQLIVDFARTLLRSLRGTDTAMRYGGDEFLMYLPDTRLERVEVILQRIRASWQIAGPLTTFSAGVAMVQPDGDPQAALAAADLRLYQAKHAGRNRWVSSPATTAAPRGRETDLAQTGG